jgi:hypothetical protein
MKVRTGIALSIGHSFLSCCCSTHSFKSIRRVSFLIGLWMALSCSPVWAQDVSAPNRSDSTTLLTLWDSYTFSQQDPTGDPVFVRKFQFLIRNAVPETIPFVVRSLDRMLEKAAVNKSVYTRLAEMLNYLFNDFGSPIRNASLGLHVLQTLSVSPYLESSVRERYAFEFRQASLNAVGTSATDFSFVTLSGKSSSLYEQSASWLVLYFCNPGCEACEQTTLTLKNNPQINRLLDAGKLKILAVYPDREVEAWKTFAKSEPRWLHGWDSQDVIRTKNLYSMEAIPSIYLLDATKKVVLRDATLQDLLVRLQAINP